MIRNFGCPFSIAFIFLQFWGESEFERPMTTRLRGFVEAKTTRVWRSEIDAKLAGDVEAEKPAT